MAAIDLTGASTNLVVMAAKLKQGGVNQGDLVKAIYALAYAVYAICNNLDDDNATIGTDYLAKIGTPLNTAILSLVEKPSGETTAA